MKPNREAVIAIQGGGVYGLSLLGQLRAVIDDHHYLPLAFAGTSAGAIVATLTWAGFRPSEVEEEFVALAQQDRLVRLLDPPKMEGFNIQELAKLKATFLEVVSQTGSRQNQSSWFRPWTKCPNFLRWISLVRMVNGIVPHYRNRGFFTGDSLQAAIESLLLKKIKVPETIVSKGDCLRFGHVDRLMHDCGVAEYRPPLLLTATNLTRGRLEIISSIDKKYENVPIAKAVRASAGFPVFFTPQEIPECPDGGWFVDGGLVSNFPIWTFSDAFRSQIEHSHSYDIYGHIVNRPWIRIGLRVVDDIEPAADLSTAGVFFRSLFSMVTGGSRNQLEEILALSASRSLVIKQPYAETDGPNNILDVTALNEGKIRGMVKRGREFAAEELRRKQSPSVTKYGASCTSNIRSQLADLVRSCNLVFDEASGNPNFRANIFMPVVDDQGESRMRLIYSYNMDADGDREMEFPDLHSGATGFCYSGRRPIICNLQAIGALRTSDPEKYGKLFGMSPKLQGKVREDRSWLASIPIFDPYEIRFGVVDQTQVGSKYAGASYYGLETQIDGPILGVLNLDSGWDYKRLGLDPDPNQHVADQRIRTILGIMQAVSFKVARELSEEFPRLGE